MRTFTKVGLDALLTPENCVLLLIDHQPSQLANVNSHDPTTVINNVTALAKIAKAYGVPTILTTISAQQGGAIFKQIQAVFPAQTPMVEAVDTLEEAIAAANRTLYGLTSSILAGNTYKAFEMAPKVLAGIVNVNSPTVNDEIHAPMGGVRDSGWGRTGPRSLDDFSDVIWINSQSGQRQYPI